MYYHERARLVYLAHPRTASTATAEALKRVGFTRPVPGGHHAELYYPQSPVTEETRSEWTVMTTVRNHWDAAVSWAAQRNASAQCDVLPWPRSLFVEALDPQHNSWVRKRQLYWKHLRHADIVLRYETLAEDLKHVLSIAGLYMPFLARDNISRSRHWGAHYSLYFDNETRDLIGLRFRDEIRRLNYEFDDRRENPIERQTHYAGMVVDKPTPSQDVGDPVPPDMPRGAKILDAGEECYGCGVRAMRHPWVGVMKLKGEFAEPFTWRPICDTCNRDPTNRKRRLKCHFFPRSQAERAVAAAGSPSIGG